MKFLLACVGAACIQFAFTLGAIALKALQGAPSFDGVYEQGIGATAVLALALCLQRKASS